MSWMTTIAGKQLHLDGPNMARNTLTFGEIAHALAQINRFTGHARRPESVAEHSLLVADIVSLMGLPPLAQLAALMHDAHEAIVGDVSSPLKWAIGTPWQDIEGAHAHQVRSQFGLTAAFAAWRAAIHKADMVALATERRDLVAYTPGESEPWAIIDTPGREVPPCDVNLNAQWRDQDWTRWRAAFLDRFLHLKGQVNAVHGITLPAVSA